MSRAECGARRKGHRGWRQPDGLTAQAVIAVDPGRPPPRRRTGFAPAHGHVAQTGHGEQAAGVGVGPRRIHIAVHRGHRHQVEALPAHQAGQPQQRKGVVAAGVGVEQHPDHAGNVGMGIGAVPGGEKAGRVPLPRPAVRG